MATFSQNWHLGVDCKVSKNIGQALNECKNTIVRNDGFCLFLSVEQIEVCINCKYNQSKAISSYFVWREFSVGQYIQYILIIYIIIYAFTVNKWNCCASLRQ